jgi:hypothetical protein
LLHVEEKDDPTHDPKDQPQTDQENTSANDDSGDPVVLLTITFR